MTTDYDTSTATRELGRCRNKHYRIQSSWQKAISKRDKMKSSFLTAVAVLVFNQVFHVDVAFLVQAWTASHKFRILSTSLHGSKNKNDNKVPDVVTKASWYAVEAFGNLFKKDDKNTAPAVAFSTDQPPRSKQETQERIRLDNERYYFLSGTIDELIYSEDCTFADPFVSFKGRDRFVQNLSNLGSFITKYNVKQLDYTVSPDDNAVTTKFMVKLQLNLPWEPVLAWPWGVRCEIDPGTNLIVLHEESVRK